MKNFKELLEGCEHDGSFIPVNEVIRIIKSAQQDSFREGYYAGNGACKRMKDSLIMEDIIKKDFTKIYGGTIL